MSDESDFYLPDLAGGIPTDDLDLSKEDPFELGDFGENFTPINHSSWKDNLKNFEAYLANRRKTPEPYFGMFAEDIAVCKFFEHKNSESILSEIMQKNTETGMGNVVIPNTNINLVNYSYCPNCNKIYSQKMLSEYYRKPVIRPGTCLRHALREETRVVCDDCSTSFFPTLIIVDGTPKNEVQYLCRNQVIEAIEKYMEQNYNEKVLTRNLKNTRVNREDKLIACANDIQISKLEKSPTLITNFIQYTPAPYILNFINGENIANDDLVFNYWSKPKTEKERKILDIVSG